MNLTKLLAGQTIILITASLFSGCATSPCFDLHNPEYATERCISLRAANEETDQSWGDLNSTTAPGTYGYPPLTPGGQPSNMMLDQFGRPLQPAPYGTGVVTDQYGRPVQQQSPQYPPGTYNPSNRQQNLPNNPVPRDQWGRPVQTSPPPQQYQGVNPAQPGITTPTPLYNDPYLR